MGLGSRFHSKFLSSAGKRAGGGFVCIPPESTCIPPITSIPQPSAQE